MNSQKIAAPQNRIEDDEDGSMVLEEEIDENYEPTQEEILEYAQFLGMDLQKDKEFFYIAREGLKAPLPDIWKPAKNRKGDIYYINIENRKTQWEHPCDEYYKKLFQDAKKKKSEGGVKVQQKQTTKFKSNLPMGNNATASKYNPLPLIKEVGSQQRVDTGGSSENQNTLSLNNPDFSLDNSPIPKQQKKLHDKSNLAESQKLGSILNELKEDFSGAEEMAKMDKEYEEKSQTYQKEKDIEADEIIEKNLALKDNHERKLKSDMEKDLESYKVKMIDKIQSINQTLAEERKKAHQNLVLEYKKETESAIKRLDQEHPNVKRKLELQEARETDKAMEGEEEKIIRDIENRIIGLTKLHKELEREQSKMQERRIQKEKELEYRLDDERLQIENEFKMQLQNFESNEIATQRTEIEHYKTNLRVQLNEEKSALAIAEKQRKSLALAREAELKEEYDQKYQEGKGNIDQEINQRLKEYEREECIKKDRIIQLHKDNEMRAEKDKKQAAHQIEIGKLQGNFKNRLENYERQLKQKFDSEKQLIDQENNLILEKHRNDVENIRTNISNREEIVHQIKKTQEKNEEVNREIYELDRKSEQQKRENEQLQRKLDDLRNRQKMQSKLGAATAVRDLELKIQEADRTVKQLSKPQIIVSNSLITHQKPSKILNSSSSKLNSSYYKIMDDIDEIKSILATKGDDKERLNSSISTPNKIMSSRLSPTILKGMLSDKSRLSRSRADTHQENFEKWITIYNEESDRLAEIKVRLEECKTIVAKKQSEILQGQERLKNGMAEYRLSANRTPQRKSGLKRLKANLDKEVQKVNQNVHDLRDADLRFEIKEKLLSGLGNIARRMNIDDHEGGQLQNIYKRYQEIEIKLPNLIEEKRFQFYDTWKDIVENQLTMDNDLSDTEREYETKTHNESMNGRFSSLDFKGSVSQNRLEAILSPKSIISPKYSYDNLVRVLDFQSKSEAIFPETLMLQRHVTEAQEGRAKIKNVFNNHSDWLKNVKQKLNNQLYDKTASFSSRSTLMPHNSLL